MKSNYLSLNGQKIQLSDKQTEQIRAALGIQAKRLGDIPLGDTFWIREWEFVVLEHAKETTAVILKDFLLTSERFGSTNNYDGSNVDGICSRFAEEIAGAIGTSNLIEHTVDLIADDGLKCYGKVRRKMSLLTAGLYRRYVYILDKHKPRNWWWLATAFSTRVHNDRNCVKCVAPSGCVGNYYSDGSCGVRPFCILNSDIFVS